jgi:hypothetical protein
LQSLFELINLPEEEKIILNSINNDILNMCYVIYNLIFRKIMQRMLFKRLYYALMRIKGVILMKLYLTILETFLWMQMVSV